MFTTPIHTLDTLEETRIKFQQRAEHLLTCLSENLRYSTKKLINAQSLPQPPPSYQNRSLGD